MRDFLHCVVETVNRTEYNKISETRAMLFKTIWQPFTGCFLVSSQFRLRRFFSGSVHCSWVHCHLASVSLDFASLIYRVWLRSLAPSLSLSFSLFRICPFHFRKHHIDSSVHALCLSLSVILSRPPASFSTLLCGSRKKTKTRMREYF